MIERRHIAKTLTYVGIFSWIGFSLIELLLPTAVLRTFSPHLFLPVWIAGVIWWYYERTQG